MDMLNGLHLPFRFDPNLLKADLALVRPEEWTPHYNERDYGGDWRGVALRSLSGRPNHLASSHEGQCEEFLDTELMARCSYFRQVLTHFQCPLKSVRLLKLAAGSFVREHSDPALGYEDGEVRIHVPIQTNAAVEFYSGGDRLSLAEGDCYYVNVSLPHRVNNRSLQDRIHLVIDADVNEWLHDWFRQGLPIPRPALSQAGFETFRNRVFRDPELQRRLHAIPGHDAFVAETVHLAREAGFDFHSEDVEADCREPVMRSAQPQRGWAPIAFRVRDSLPCAEWAYFGSRRFIEPFFGDTVRTALQNPFARAFRQETQLEAGDTPAPAGFIFHMSRCGSTLVAQMLAAVPDNTVISEAPPVDEAIRSGRADWVRFILAAFGAKFIKLDAWHIHNLPLIREAFPETPWVFLYRDPLEVLASQLRSPGMQALPGAMDPAILGLRQEDITTLGREKWCVRVLAGFCQSALLFRDDPHGMFLNYRELPGAVWGRLAKHFGISFSDSELTRMCAAASFDAKTPSQPFQADSDERKFEVSQLVRDLCHESLDPLYRALKALSR
jgi:hypothetical protein